MKIYDYSNIKECLVCGSIDGKLDKFIQLVVSGIVNRSNYENPIHPKELERQNRLSEMSSANNPHQMRFRRSDISRSSVKCPYCLNESVLIVNGSNVFIDKDLNYYIRKLEALNNALVDNNTHILFVRGNDNPEYFNNELINLSNIKTIVDYSVIKFDTFNCLCVGGNISLSRSWKIEQEKLNGKKIYWETEKLHYDEQALENIINEYNISCVITNSCPSFVCPSMNEFGHLPWVEKDRSLLYDICNERMKMDKMYNIIIRKKPYIWVYSRFNMNDNSTVNDILFQSINKLQIFSFNITAKNVFQVDFSKTLQENKFVFTLNRKKESWHEMPWSISTQLVNPIGGEAVIEDEEANENEADEAGTTREYIEDGADEARATREYIEDGLVGRIGANHYALFEAPQAVYNYERIVTSLDAIANARFE